MSCCSKKNPYNLNRLHEHQRKHQHTWESRRERTGVKQQLSLQIKHLGWVFGGEHRREAEVMIWIYFFVVLCFIKHFSTWTGKWLVTERYPVHTSYGVPEKNMCKYLRRSKLLTFRINEVTTKWTVEKLVLYNLRNHWWTSGSSGSGRCLWIFSVLLVPAAGDFELSVFCYQLFFDSRSSSVPLNSLEWWGTVVSDGNCTHARHHAGSCKNAEMLCHQYGLC